MTIQITQTLDARGLSCPMPIVTVAKGIEQLVEYYRRYGLLLEDLMGERHQRLRRVAALRQTGALDARLRWTAVTLPGDAATRA